MADGWLSRLDRPFCNADLTDSFTTILISDEHNGCQMLFVDKTLANHNRLAQQEHPIEARLAEE